MSLDFVIMVLKLLQFSAHTPAVYDDTLVLGGGGLVVQNVGVLTLVRPTLPGSYTPLLRQTQQYSSHTIPLNS